MNPALKDFSQAFIKFKASWMKFSRTIWINDEYDSTSSHSWTKESVKETFAYGIPNETCFPREMFELDRERLLLADRYGGRGIGTNGGGGRIGIIGDCQIKGVGQNPLVGNRDNQWHSYGGQSLINAVLEAINSTVFGHILPLGTIKCLGIIFTGTDTAYMPSGGWDDERGPGALLIRELCMRPAHFLRAPGFQMQEEYRDELLDDVERVRCLNKQLRNVMGDHENVVQFLATFLSNCADQFVFARIFGIHHGVLSPSNISLDGRWIDLTNISFVGSGINFTEDHELVTFYDEMHVVLQYINEFVHTYAKYNHIDFDIRPLEEYYHREVDACFVYYAATLFGLAAKNAEDIKPDDPYITLVSGLKKVLSTNPAYVVASPVGFHSDGPTVMFVERMFRGLGNEGPSDDDLCKSFHQTVLSAYRSSNVDFSFSSFVVLSAIKSLKKAYFSSFFTRGRIVAQLLRLVKEEDPEFFAGYIDGYTVVAKWMFQGESCAEEVLFKSERVNLSYAANDKTYRIELDGTVMQRIVSAKGLSAWIEKQREQFFSIDNYDFKPGLLRLLSRLEELEVIGDQERSVA